MFNNQFSLRVVAEVVVLEDGAVVEVSQTFNVNLMSLKQNDNKPENNWQTNEIKK